MLCLNCIQRTWNSKLTNILKLVTDSTNFQTLHVCRASKMASCIKKQSSYFHTSSSIASELDFFKQHIQKPNKKSKQPLGGDKLFIREIEPQSDLSVLEPLVVSLDCEMVKTTRSTMSLARCSIVNYNGEVLLDIYVKQTCPVLNYFTRYSGITEKHLLDPGCLDFQEARNKVLNTIKNKLVVGHSLNGDLKSLGLSLPQCQVIDIVQCPDVLETLRVNFPSNRKCSLKVMSDLLLNHTIQTLTHCSVEDARATMNVFKLVSHLWLNKNPSVVQKFSKNNNMFHDKFWLPYTNN